MDIKGNNVNKNRDSKSMAEQRIAQKGQIRESTLSDNVKNVSAYGNGGVESVRHEKTSFVEQTQSEDSIKQVKAAPLKYSKSDESSLFEQIVSAREQKSNDTTFDSDKTDSIRKGMSGENIKKDVDKKNSLADIIKRKEEEKNIQLNQDFLKKKDAEKKFFENKDVYDDNKVEDDTEVVEENHNTAYVHSVDQTHKVTHTSDYSEKHRENKEKIKEQRKERIREKHYQRQQEKILNAQVAGSIIGAENSVDNIKKNTRVTTSVKPKKEQLRESQRMLDAVSQYVHSVKSSRILGEYSNNETNNVKKLNMHKDSKIFNAKVATNKVDFIKSGTKKISSEFSSAGGSVANQSRSAVDLISSVAREDNEDTANDIINTGNQAIRNVAHHFAERPKKQKNETDRKHFVEKKQDQMLQRKRSAIDVLEKDGVLDNDSRKAIEKKLGIISSLDRENITGKGPGSASEKQLRNVAHRNDKKISKMEKKLKRSNVAKENKMKQMNAKAKMKDMARNFTISKVSSKAEESVPLSDFKLTGAYGAAFAVAKTVLLTLSGMFMQLMFSLLPIFLPIFIIISCVHFSFGSSASSKGNDDENYVTVILGQYYDDFEDDYTNYKKSGYKLKFNPSADDRSKMDDIIAVYLYLMYQKDDPKGLDDAFPKETGTYASHYLCVDQTEEVNTLKQAFGYLCFMQQAEKDKQYDVFYIGISKFEEYNKDGSYTDDFLDILKKYKKYVQNNDLSTNESSATGTYQALKNVKPSIEIPKNAGGLGVPLYLQYDSRWGNNPYGSSTIAHVGCGPSSLSMVLSYFTQSCIYPSDVVNWAKNTYYVSGQGTNPALFPAGAEHFGKGKLKCWQGTFSAAYIKQQLKKGNLIIVSTCGAHSTGAGPHCTGYFTSAGHFIVLRGLDDNGKVCVNDPNDSSSKTHYKKSYTASFIINEGKYLYVIEKK